MATALWILQGCSDTACVPTVNICVIILLLWCVLFQAGGEGSVKKSAIRIVLQESLVLKLDLILTTDSKCHTSYYNNWNMQSLCTQRLKDTTGFTMVE